MIPGHDRPPNSPTAKQAATGCCWPCTGPRSSTTNGSMAATEACSPCPGSAMREDGRGQGGPRPREPTVLIVGPQPSAVHELGDALRRSGFEVGQAITSETDLLPERCAP